jgi:hypothetical protein
MNRTRTARPWPILTLLLLLTFTPFIRAQDSGRGTVPDLTGLNVPQAAAALNKAGYALGTETNEAWSADAGVPENTISAQSVAAGEAAPAGTVVDVTVLRSPNVLLIYDDNDLTMVNQSGGQLSIGGLIFVTTAGQQRRFQARRWAGNLRPDQCTQLWSLSRNGPKGLPECAFIQNWLTTNNQRNHFWTRVSGAERFAVMLDEIERATCDAAPPNSQDNPLRCSFYLPSAAQGDVAPFIYIAYSTEALIVLNPSDDQWLQANSPTIRPTLNDTATFGANFTFNAQLFGNPQIVARVGRLAPQQCLLLVTAEGALPPEPCDVIATLVVPPAQAFWTANFEVEGADARRRTCNAATPDRQTICIMPR